VYTCTRLDTRIPSGQSVAAASFEYENLCRCRAPARPVRPAAWPRGWLAAAGNAAAAAEPPGPHAPGRHSTVNNKRTPFWTTPADLRRS